MNEVTKRIGLAAGAAALVVIIAWYFLLFGPESKELSSAHHAHAAAEAQAVSLQQQVTQLQALEKQVPADDKELARLTAAVPDNPELNQALDELHAAAVLSRAQLVDISPNTPSSQATGGSSSSSQSGTPSITVTLTVNGSYPRLMAFLHELWLIPRTVVVDNLSLSGSNPLTASIGARIFYAGQPTP